MNRRSSPWAPALTLVGLALANITYSLARGNPDFSVAFERTSFQGIALLCAWLFW